MLVLGTGETLKRNTLPDLAPPKPTRTGSIKNHHKVETDDDKPSDDGNHKSTENTPPQSLTNGSGNETPPTVLVSNGVIEPPMKNSEHESTKVIAKSVRTKAIVDDKKVEHKPSTLPREQSGENRASASSNETSRRSLTSNDDDTSLLKAISTDSETVKNKTGDTQVEENSSKASQSTTAQPVKTNESPLVKGESPPVEGESPPVKGESPPVEGESPPVKGESPPVKGESPPVEGARPSVTNGTELVESNEPKSKPVTNDGGGYNDYVFEAARSLGMGEGTTTMCLRQLGL